MAQYDVIHFYLDYFSGKYQYYRGIKNETNKILTFHKYYELNQNIIFNPRIIRSRKKYIIKMTCFIMSAIKWNSIIKCLVNSNYQFALKTPIRAT